MSMMSDDLESNCCVANVNLVKDVLRILAKRGVYLTTRRVHKLFYLFERQCVIDTGERCFGLDYRYDRYGMYSPNLREILKHLDPQKDHLQVREVMFEKGSGKVIDYVGEWEGITLPEPVESAVVIVLSEYGYLKTETLIEKAKTTSPFVYAKKGDKIDWGKLAEERCKGSEELCPSGMKRLEEALHSESCLAFDSIDEVKSYLFS